ncbi:hypothetical protein BH11MYX3_BH11MYX3_01650 [soil metagenome]
MTLRAALAILAVLSGPVVAAPAGDLDAPPATLVAGEPTYGAKIDPVFAHLTLARLSCSFTEQKHVALLAKPLRSTGTILFERDRGIVRTTLTPKPQQVVLTKTTLRIKKDKRVEEVPLDKSKDLKAFATIFPTLLRGERAELEKAFTIGLYGSDADWWALTFAPKTESLKKLVKSVTVFGKKSELVSLQVIEASGDSTDTQLASIRKNKDVTDAEITTAFGASEAR